MMSVSEREGLAESKIGCNLGSVYVGALAYADDLVLFASTAFAMRKLLRICENYARDYSVVFSAKKVCMLVQTTEHLVDAGL